MKKLMYIKAPINSVDYRIDDFLGNSFQFKVGDEWFYDTSASLPNYDLEIIGILEENELIELGLDPNFKWVKIQEN